MKSKRIGTIDLLRVIATIAVIIIHTTDDLVLAPNHKGGIVWGIFTFINTLGRFAVPLFILLSGYLHNPKDNGKDIKKNIKKYTPLLGWFLFYWLVFLLFQPWKQDNSISLAFANFIKVRYLHLYFIEILLMVQICRSLLGLYVKRIYSLSLLSLLLIQFVIWGTFQLSSYFKQEIYVQNIITVGLLYLPTYLMGYQLAKLKKSSLLENTLITFFGLGFIVLSIFKSRLLLSDYYSNMFINNLSPFTIGFALLLLRKIRTINLGKMDFSNLAILCLFVYIIHPLVLLCVNRLFHLDLHLLSGNLLYWYGLKIMLVTIFSFALSYCLDFTAQLFRRYR